MVGKRGTSRTYRCPPEHKHGKTGTCFNQHGCGCFPCVESRRVYQLERDRLVAYGRWEAGNSVDASGTRRRLRALAYMGWSSALLAAELDTRDTHVRQLQMAERCSKDTRERVKVVYDRLWNKVPPGGPRAYTANMARRKGWVGPLSWDDDLIDEYHVEPETGEEDIA